MYLRGVDIYDVLNKHDIGVFCSIMQNYIVVESVQEEEVAKATEKVKSRLDNILNGGNGDFFDVGVVGLPYGEDEDGYKHYGALPPETVPIDGDNPFPMLEPPVSYG